MKKFTKLMAVVMAVVCIFSMFTIGASAAEKDNVCSIKLESSIANPQPGDSFTVTVSAKTNYPIINVNTVIAYDKAYFEVATSGAVKLATKMPVSLNQNSKSPLSMYPPCYSEDMINKYKLVFASVTWLPSLAPKGNETTPTTLTDFEPLFTIKFKMKSNAPTDGKGFLGIDPAFIRTENSGMEKGVYASRAGKTLGDIDGIVATGQTIDLSQAVIRGSSIKITVSDETLSMYYKSAIDFDTLVSDSRNYNIVSSDTSVVDVDSESGKLVAKKAGTAYVTVSSTDGKTRTNYEITVSYTWWQFIIIFVFFGWIWY